MDISVAIPLLDEGEPLPGPYAWIERAIQQNAYSHEVIFMNGGSTNDSWGVIQRLASQSEHVWGIRFRRNYGKSPALYCGFKETQGNVVTTMDVDLQDSPDEVPELYHMITMGGYGLVSDYKRRRHDPLSKTPPIKLFNATAHKISGIKNLYGFNCGLKAYRWEVVKSTEMYDEMHRCIPYLAKSTGFDKTGEKAVHHQMRKYGTFKFSFSRSFNGYFDLITLWLLLNLGKKPMHIFGLLGSLMSLVGLIAVIILGAEKVCALSSDILIRLITDLPYSFITLTTILIGTQLLLVGFSGDFTNHSNPGRNDYRIKKTTRREK